MSHEINELAPGVHSFVSARQDAWHKLGVTLDSNFTAQQALEEAHLANWNVRKLPIAFWSDETGDPVDIESRFATVYDNPLTKKVTYLGVVGSYYEPIQNEANVELLDAIVDESGAHFETAGSLQNGKRTFVSMKLPTTMLIGGQDPVDLYLMAMNSHDGTSNFQFAVTPIRVVCANTLRVALKNARSTFSIRHTGSAKFVLQEARDTLDLTFAYAGEFQEMADRMIEESYTTAKFDEMITLAFDMQDPKTKRKQTLVENQRESLMDLWNNSPTMKDIKGTRWGAYQAVTEYVDHFMDIKGEKNKETRSASRTITSPIIAKIKNRSFELVNA